MAEPASSPLAAALDSVGDRWTLLLVEALLDGPRRFGDLQEQSAAHRAQRAHPAPAPARERGAGGGPALQRAPAALRLRAHRRRATSWRAPCGCWPTGARATRESGEPPRHDVCGTPVEARWWCPTCERPVDDDDAGGLHFAYRASSFVATDTFSPRGGSAHTGPRGRQAAVRPPRSGGGPPRGPGRPPGREPEEVYRRRRLIAAGAGGLVLLLLIVLIASAGGGRPRAEEHALRPRRGRHEHLQGVGPRADQHRAPTETDTHGHARGAHHARPPAAPAAAPARPPRRRRRESGGGVGPGARHSGAHAPAGRGRRRRGARPLELRAAAHRLSSPRRRFDSARLRREAPVGFVARRGRCTVSALSSRPAAAPAPARGCAPGCACPAPPPAPPGRGATRSAASAPRSAPARRTRRTRPPRARP